MKFGEKNVGMIDRIVRIVVGFLVLGFGAKYLAFPVNMVIAFVGFMIVVTGVIGTCTLYSILGISTKGQRVPKTSAAVPSKPKKKSR